VSVVIAGGTRAELLRTVASVLGQTLGAVEAVVTGTVGGPVLKRHPVRATWSYAGTPDGLPEGARLERFFTPRPG
jgi:hypothetical protein